MRETVLTKDGSHTLAVPEKGIWYHSLHGALQESRHVFLQAGLEAMAGRQQRIELFEMGFGTGLNALLTAIASAEKKLSITYTAVETTPLSYTDVAPLNYGVTLGHEALFQRLHESPWNEAVSLHRFFTLQKLALDLFAYTPGRKFDLVYYDAFAPSAQPELWTPNTIEKLYAMMNEDGMLVTYCAKGNVRRALLAAGFTVERLPGPKWKREMLRATKRRSF